MKNLTNLRNNFDSLQMIILNLRIENLNEKFKELNESLQKLDLEIEELEDEFELEFLRSNEFNKNLTKHIESETWGNGLPKIYLNENNEIVEHFKDGTINVLNKSNIRNKRTNLTIVDEK